MNTEQRLAYYDKDLEVEAYRLSGIIQKFPNHFHSYYVIGFIEGGSRRLWCKNREYDLKAGDLILFNPRDNHFCTPIDGQILDYRAVNIDPNIMRKAAKEIEGRAYMPYFPENVICSSDMAQAVNDLYSSIINNEPKLKKEEAFFFLLEHTLKEHSIPLSEAEISGPSNQVKTLCAYIEENFSNNISLEDLSLISGCSKSYLLRIFTKQIGISPYRYLQTVRLDKAKKFLENGIPPIDAADMSGYSDQSHFTKFFKEFIGLTPKQYQRIFTSVSIQEKDREDFSNEHK